jgi:hypothetical protein
MDTKLFWILGVCLACASVVASGQEPEGVGAEEEAEVDCGSNAECGWWWGFWSEDEKEEELSNEIAIPPASGQKEKEEKCTSKENWSPDCGFVDPGDDYDFMVVQRDELSKTALMNSTDQKSVREFQRYMNWMVTAAIEYSQTWQYNMIQDTEINPFSKHPISGFGLKATFGMFKDFKRGIYDEIIDQDGVLIFWTRASCKWCEVQAEAVLSLVDKTGIPAYNISIEGPCVKGFEGEFCRSADELAIDAATELKIAMVPDLFLLLNSKDPSQNAWIRVATGIEDSSRIERRIYTFFEGVKAAAEQGLVAAKNDFEREKRPNVSFDSDYYKPDRNGYQGGVIKAEKGQKND